MRGKGFRLCESRVARKRHSRNKNGFDADEAPAVYAWASRAGFAQVAPVKGVEGFNRSSPITWPSLRRRDRWGKRLRRAARLWAVAVSTFKFETSASSGSAGRARMRA